MNNLYQPTKSGAAGTPDLAMQTRNYPFNCWWVAALSDEVSRSFVSRWVLEMPILLYRQEDGTPVAIQDRCPHRSVPLSMGTLRGDNVVCGYHGFEFAPDGKCVRVPTQANPGSIKARAYPLIEQYPFIWIYTGDLDQIDSVQKPMKSISWGADPSTVVVYGYFHINANYMMLNENVLDISHVPIVHGKSLQADRITPFKSTSDGDTVKYVGLHEHGPLPHFHAMGSGLDLNKTFDQYLYGEFQTPSLETAATEFSDPNPAPGEQKDFMSYICHATTPIDMNTMHYWWATGRNYGTDDAQFKRDYAKMVNTAFEEDEILLNAAQKVKDSSTYLPEPPDFSVGADAAAVLARRVLEKWLARETFGKGAV